MKKILLTLLSTFVFSSVFAQICPTPTNNGVHITLETNYQLGTFQTGKTPIGLCFYNNTVEKITATQFRVFYDNNAFLNVDTIISTNTSFPQYIQYVDNPTNGYVTITFTYTGIDPQFNIPNGSQFEITFNHTAALSTTYFNVSNMSFVGTNSFPETATTQAGIDYTLSLTNFGGVFVTPKMSFRGRFVNVTGSGAKNINVNLEKKLKSSSTWANVTQELTDTSGRFFFTDVNIDTTAFDVRINVQGDTMGVGAIVSISDAQKINQYVLGTSTPTGFDYYTSDVNGDNRITMSDVYSVYSRVGGRFSSWPNSVQDILFFTQNQFTTINGSNNNNTSNIPGVTNFTFQIIAGQPDSVTYYVAIPGDANATGFRMARLIPIEVINPNNSPNNIIDGTTFYDETKEVIEINLPKINVSEGNLINIPLILKTNNTRLGSLQFALDYDSDILEFKSIKTEKNSTVWMSYINTQNGIVEWGGFDPTNNRFLTDNDELFFTLQFQSKKPKEEWGVSPLYVTRKFAGDNNATDLKITPTDGVVRILRISGGALGGNDIVVYPNPTQDIAQLEFVILNEAKTTLGIYDMNGRKCIDVLNDNFPLGQYHYTINLGHMSPGTYVAILDNGSNYKTIKIQKIWF
jgi:hypothetical protein